MMSDTQNSKRVVIVGAGLSGLTCAMRLSKAGFEVSIIEELTYPGGLLASTRIGNEYLEILPHHIRKTDKALLSLIKEEGLDSRLQWFDSLWYGKASRKKVGYFTDGFVALINRLIQDITDNGGHIYYSTTVSDISKAYDVDGEGVHYTVSCVLTNSARQTIECDYLIYTGSCRSFINVGHNLPFSINIKDQLMNVTYTACLSLMLVLKRQHSEVYFQSTPSSMPFSRIVNHSNCFGVRDYGGNVVYMVGNCNVSDPIWIAADQDIMEKYFQAFRKLYPVIKKSDIKAWRLTKIRYANTERYPLEDLTNPLPNLYVCADGLADFSSKEIPLNRMEHVISLANSITQKIISIENDNQQELTNETESNS